MALTAHQKRIKAELAKAGMTSYGQHKMTSRYLPTIIGETEHIEGVVYGHAGVGLAMLVATDRRVIYLERRPLFTSTDEVSYEVVVGVRYVQVGLFPAFELHTRMGNYTLTYVNPKCAHIFQQYIERRIEHLALDHTDEPHLRADGTPITPKADEPAMPAAPKKVFTAAARNFLNAHEVAVLSTTDRTGSVDGVTIYYLFGTNDKIYMITKSDTAKAHNMLSNHQVALTIFDAEELKTAQIQGYAEIEADPATKRAVFERLIRLRQYGGEKHLPPITELDAGGFIAFRITPTNVKYTDFKQADRLTPSRSANEAG